MLVQRFPSRSSAATLLIYTLCVLPGNIAENESVDTSDDNIDASDPWETPLQELQRITNRCALKLPGFYELAYDAEVNWQSCIDSITPQFPILETRRGRNDSPLNDSVILELDRQLHMAICSNTTAYKGCWLSVLAALNECEPGIGDVAGKVYFALYEDICRDGGRITVENRRKAAVEGRPCLRDYSTKECSMSKMLRHSKDLCTRFQSNTACDLSSIDPNCSNQADKRLHAEIFLRVGHVLQCSFSDMSNAMSRTTGVLPTHIFTMLIVLINFIFKFN
ncbi:unnamed protein product [Orchesella dallaii]|uniref:Secreted protein n=1 Tax=Orchesella dallaii TaxID=48710 RepID=A0ABP1QNF7_9HEXA